MTSTATPPPPKRGRGRPPKDTRKLGIRIDAKLYDQVMERGGAAWARWVIEDALRVPAAVAKHLPAKD